MCSRTSDRVIVSSLGYFLSKLLTSLLSTAVGKLVSRDRADLRTGEADFTKWGIVPDRPVYVSQEVRLTSAATTGCAWPPASKSLAKGPAPTLTDDATTRAGCLSHASWRTRGWTVRMLVLAGCAVGSAGEADPIEPFSTISEYPSKIARATATHSWAGSKLLPSPPGLWWMSRGDILLALDSPAPRRGLVAGLDLFVTPGGVFLPDSEVPLLPLLVLMLLELHSANALSCSSSATSA